MLFGAWNVNVNEFPALPAVTLVGLTAIVPSPSLAFASVNVVCAWETEPAAVRVK